MKLLRYSPGGRAPAPGRLGVLVGGDRVGDLQAGYAQLVRGRSRLRGQEPPAARFPAHLTSLLAAGESGWSAARATAEYLEALAASAPDATGPGGDLLFTPLADCRLRPPLRPSKMIAVGRNYDSHVRAAGGEVRKAAVPVAWIKANSTIAGPHDDIVKPDCVRQLDYETELAVVISQRCKYVPEARAYDVVAGYLVMNDISARDIGWIERREGGHFLDKMFDSFAPMGPWLVTRDEVADPMDLRLVTRVNGEVRQDASTREMTWSIPKMIAYLSQMTLEPGDIILTGTPSGTAVERKSSQSPWFLEPGDVLESEVQSIGVLRNPVVAEAPTQGSWAWPQEEAARERADL